MEKSKCKIAYVWHLIVVHVRIGTAQLWLQGLYEVTLCMFNTNWFDRIIKSSRFWALQCEEIGRILFSLLIWKLPFQLDGSVSMSRVTWMLVSVHAVDVCSVLVTVRLLITWNREVSLVGKWLLRCTQTTICPFFLIWLGNEKRVPLLLLLPSSFSSSSHFSRSMHLSRRLLISWRTLQFGLPLNYGTSFWNKW